MNTTQEIARRLVADFKFKPDSNGWLSGGKCPSCGKFEAYTNADKPYTLFCSRQNKCGARTKVRDAYPDLFGDYNRRFRKTRRYPTATADAYMRLERGFDPALIAGWYSQGHYKNPNADKETATVRFTVADGVYMDRFVENLSIKDPETGVSTIRNKSFKGKWGGMWWQPPTLEIIDGDELWIVEGCLDAIALNLNGKKAVSNLSAGHYPQKALAALKGRNITLVWSLDNDHAGKSSMQKHITLSKADGFKAVAAYIPSKLSRAGKVDWNDLHIQDKLDEDFLKLCRWHGDLMMVQTAYDKAMMIHERFDSSFFCFEFRNRTYGFEIDQKVLNASIEADDSYEAALRKACKISEIANFAMQFNYFKRNNLTKESWYSSVLRFPHRGKSMRCDFTSAQIAVAPEFKKCALNAAPGAVFTGKGSHLDWMCRQHLFNIKTVETVDFIGYSKKHGAYIFDKIAFKDGRQYALNSEDYFEIGDISLVSLFEGISLNITEAGDYKPEWVKQVWKAWGAKGIAALAFWFGTLFAEQIRERHESFPFMELVGEAGTGKSTLVEFLWRLFGRADEEGFDPAKATPAARSRKFSQVSNLPIVLIEADRDATTIPSRQFDWEETKPLYNGRGLRSTGIKNSGNETKDPPFRGALMVVQNEAVSASQAVMQRFISIAFDSSAYSKESKQAADALKLLTVQQVSFFLAKCLQNEAAVLEQYAKYYTMYETALMDEPEITTPRVAKTHAQLFAFADALFPIIDLEKDKRVLVREQIKAMAIERQHSIGGDHPIVQNFWEIAEYLHSRTDYGINHCIKSHLVGINLREFVELASLHRQELPPLDALKKHLKSGSKTRKLVQTSYGVTSRIGKKAVRCWIFEDIPNSPFKEGGAIGYAIGDVRERRA